jgi:hypothetical protein
MSSIYLSRKVGRLVVCFVDRIEISQNHGASCHPIGTVGKDLDEKGALIKLVS